VRPADYHDRTKHHVNRLARSSGYLDWASQPAPFRAYTGAPVTSLVPRAPVHSPPYFAYGQLFDPPDGGGPGTAAAIGNSLRYALGLSAWKSFRGSRWALRVNPSSGNLHPTEAYVVTGPLIGVAATAGVYHYAPDRHELELRVAFDADAWRAAAGGAAWLVALTSIHWREAWKYGERAFRYCQHDLGHAVAALAMAARLEDLDARMLPGWSRAAIGALVGADRDSDFGDAEREEPACVLAVGRGDGFGGLWSPAPRFLDAIARGSWTGHATRLSGERLDWPAIDEVAEATADPGRGGVEGYLAGRTPRAPRERADATSDGPDPDARTVLLQRRSAVAFDGTTSLAGARFVAMLARTLPGPGAPWSALWWTPRLHLALFVHRVDGIEPGLYLLPRDRDAVPRLREAFGNDFLWEVADDSLPLVRLARGDGRRISQHVSCDQAIAADGCFSVAMIADFARSLDEYGPSFYRHLFWEAGVIGQVLYLEAEAAGARGTGIGCFFDDLVHDRLGITDHRFQSLYHFAVGRPVDDARLTTEPGYPWEPLAP